MRRAVWLEVLLFTSAGVCLALGTEWSLRSPGDIEMTRAADSALRVMTWNVGSPGGRGGSALRSVHLPMVAESIARAELDLCILQEIAGPAQLERLRSALGTEWSALISESGSRRVAALAPRATLERLDLSSGVSRSLALAFDDSEGIGSFFVVGLHADAWSSRERNREIGSLAQALAEFAAPPHKLLVGDFNLDVEQRGDLFSDDEHLDLETYNFVAQHWLDAGLGKGPSAEPDRRLDYIFVDPAGLRVLQAGPWKGQRVGDMDHDPVLADVRLR